MSAEQVAAMDDGTVTQAEYEAAFRRYSACLAEEGYTVIEMGVAYDLIDARIPAEAVTSGADEKCYQKEYAQVDAAWQDAHINTSYTAEVVRSCLVNAGVAPAATLLEMQEQLGEAGIAFDECL